MLKEKLPLDDPDVARLYSELDRYTRTGESYSDRIRLGYVALVKFTKQEHITLRKLQS